MPVPLCCAPIRLEKLFFFIEILYICIGCSKYETKSSQKLRFEDQSTEIAEPGNDVQSVDNDEEETESMEQDKTDDVDHEYKEDEEDENNECLDGDHNGSESETKEIAQKSYQIIIEGTEDIFSISDLENIEYFKNYFSSRWLNNKNKKSIEIPICNDKKFEISELKVIVYYKKYKMIDNEYNVERIKYLIDSLDYFTEIIDNKTYYQYLLNHIPMIEMNEIDEMMKSMNDYQENKGFLQFQIAVNDYKKKQREIRLETKNKFIREWDKIPIDIIVKMKHISYEIFMKSMKLIKVNETQSDQYIYDRWDRDCEIDIKFLHKRSINDLNKIWNVVKNSKNHQYLLNIISTLTSSFSERANLETWSKHSRAGILHHNKYKVVEYRNNICSINGQMITHVFNVFLNDKSIDITSYNVLNDIMTMYTNSINKQTEIDKFYRDIIDAYFEKHRVYHSSFIIIFRNILKTHIFNIFNSNSKSKILADKFQKLSDEIKHEFLQSIFKLIISKDKNDKMIEKIIIFFMENNKKETIEFILEHHQKVFMIEFVNLFRNILRKNNDENVMSQIYSIMIDNYFTDSSNFDASVFMISCQCFTKTEILNRFTIITEKQKINYLDVLFTSNICDLSSFGYNDFVEKRKEIGSVLLKHNIFVAKETFDAWFKTLMLDEKQWIIKQFLSTDNISFNFLEKVLNIISDIIVTEKQEVIPQEYFDFVDQHTY